VFERVTVRASDPEASERFYSTVLPTLGFEDSWMEFAVAAAADDDSVTRGLHIGFVAPSREHVHRFWQAGVDAGYRDDGEPGPRPEYGDEYYGGFLLDPDGNSAEAVHNDSLRQGGVVDHLWIRVADVAASKRYYEALASNAGFHLQTDMPLRAQFLADNGSGSFSVLAGERTRNLEMAFRARRPGQPEVGELDPDGNRVELLDG
jgi:catechol 2,3-dioxygenase-like lactoylglutathione lyase family enzyme